jgi:hypothetical protein
MAARRSHRLFAVFALTVLAPVGLAACGDDDDDATTATTVDGTDTTASGDEGDLDAYCEATVEIETVEEPDIDFESLTPEQQAEEAKRFATGSLRPIVDRIVAAAPAEIADDIEILDGAVAKIETTGDFEAFETPEVEAASDRVHEHDVTECEWTRQDVKAVEYKFEGVPASVDAGIASFEFANAGKEFHEMIVLRKNDGVTESFQDLLALPEEEAMTKATVVGADFEAPGEEGYAVLDLEAGDYAMVCFIPVGTVDEETEVDGPPHFTQGMIQEFKVA